MLIELLSFGMLLAATEAQPEWLATVRHYSPKTGQSWKLELQHTPTDRPAAKLWWIVGPTVHTGFPAHLVRASGLDESELPDLLTARVADLTGGQCAAIGAIAGELAKLRETLASLEVHAIDPSDPRTLVFTLETPSDGPVDLTSLAADHPLVRWAHGAWDELADCAGVESD